MLRRFNDRIIIRHEFWFYVIEYMMALMLFLLVFGVDNILYAFYARISHIGPTEACECFHQRFPLYKYICIIISALSKHPFTPFPLRVQFFKFSMSLKPFCQMESENEREKLETANERASDTVGKWNKWHANLQEIYVHHENASQKSNNNNIVQCDAKSFCVHWQFCVPSASHSLLVQCWTPQL